MDNDIDMYTVKSQYYVIIYANSYYDSFIPRRKYLPTVLCTEQEPQTCKKLLSLLFPNLLTSGPGTRINEFNYKEGEG